LGVGSTRRKLATYAELKQNKLRQISMPPTTPVSERTKTVHALVTVPATMAGSIREDSKKIKVKQKLI
jgi:hypothetical protein